MKIPFINYEINLSFNKVKDTQPSFRKNDVFEQARLSEVDFFITIDNIEGDHVFIKIHNANLDYYEGRHVFIHEKKLTIKAFEKMITEQLSTCSKLKSTNIPNLENKRDDIVSGKQFPNKVEKPKYEKYKPDR